MYLDILDVPHTGLIQVQCRMLGEIHFLTTLVAVPEMSSSCGSSGDAKASCSGVAMVALQCPDLPGLFFDSNIRASLWVSMLWLLMFVDNIQITYNFYTISIQTKVDRKKAKEGVRLPRIFSHLLAFKETKSERWWVGPRGINAVWLIWPVADVNVFADVKVFGQKYAYGLCSILKILKIDKIAPSFLQRACNCSSSRQGGCTANPITRPAATPVLICFEACLSHFVTMCMHVSCTCYTYVIM